MSKINLQSAAPQALNESPAARTTVRTLQLNIRCSASCSNAAISILAPATQIAAEAQPFVECLMME